MAGNKNLGAWSTPSMMGGVNPSTDLVVNSITVAGDVKVTDPTKGLVLTDSNSAEHRITVNTDNSPAISDPLGA